MLLAPPAEAYFFLKRRYAAECAVLRAARAQNAALVEKNGAARMRSRGGRLNFRRAPRTPVSLAQSFHSIIASILRSGVYWARLSWVICWVPN